jgi:hypothetical protein
MRNALRAPARIFLCRLKSAPYFVIGFPSTVYERSSVWTI